MREQPGESIFRNVDKNYDYVEYLRLELFVSFKIGCKPFIGFDDCQLRSKYLDILLSALALDGNNGLFHIAFVVVEGESGDT